METITSNMVETLGNLSIQMQAVAVIVGAIILNAVSSFLFAKRNNKKRKTPMRKFVLCTPEEEGDPKLSEFEGGAWEFRCGADPEREQTLNIKTTGTKIGRSFWKYVPFSKQMKSEKISAKQFDRALNCNAADEVYRTQMTADETIENEVPKQTGSLGFDAMAAAIYGSKYYAKLQTDQGYWPGDYGGPMFLLPGLVIACHVTGVDIGLRRKQAMLRYLLNHQQEDGGWGTHIEGHSTMFGSAMNYVAARLLGLRELSDEASKARLFIRAHGGAVMTPQWGKFWMSVLGVHDWAGCNSVPPELWCLPYWFPFHPGRMWCHARMVYLPMSALFGSRFVYENAEDDLLVLALREELYCDKYEFIDWAASREKIASIDVYSPQTKLMTFLNFVLYYTLENSTFRSIFGFVLNPLRRAGLKFAFEYIRAEDIQTNWVDIGPVNKAMNMVCTYADSGADSDAFQRHIPRIEDFLWLAEDGMKMQGYNGSQLWDTGFAATGMAFAAKAHQLYNGNNDTIPEVTTALRKSYQYIDDSQVRQDEDNMDRYYRHISKGGWPFSTQDHGWPISDCTSEGLKTAILLDDPELSVIGNNAQQAISRERYEDAVNVILSMQNIDGDGGWASYELNRGWDWYEYLNPAIVFGDIMIDYSYVECTSACVQALCKFGKTYPDTPRMKEIVRSVEGGLRLILNKHKQDGSWYGSWAVCFTYGGWFGVEGLAAAYDFLDESSKLYTRIPNALRSAVEYTLTTQNEDGGWGESIKACGMKRWVPNENEGSQIVNTSWALLSLVRAMEILTKLDGEEPYQTKVYGAMEDAIRFLISRQLPTGDWAQESVSGVFNKSCAITYTAYRNAFPIWALSRYALWVKSSKH